MNSLGNQNFSILEKFNKNEIELSIVTNRLAKIEASLGWRLVKKMQYYINNFVILKFVYLFLFKKKNK